jgi:membrane protease YdiL (CAAX protease family)
MTDAAAAPRSFAQRASDNRLVRFFVMFTAVMAADVGVQIFTGVVAKSAPADSAALYRIGAAAISAAVLLVVYAVLVLGLERRRVRELEAARAPSGLLGGALIGLGLFASAIAVLYAMGVARIVETPGNDLLGAANMAVLAGVGEELLFRGIVFRLFEEMFGSFAALLVSALFFGAVHLANQGATLTSGAAIAIEAGLLLGAAYMWSRTLWLPIGLHFGWNFAESAIFGSVVSGIAFKGVLHTTLTGPELLTGGKFGPEASVVAVGLCAAAALAIALRAVRRGEWQPLRLAINSRR